MKHKGKRAAGFFPLVSLYASENALDERPRVRQEGPDRIRAVLQPDLQPAFSPYMKQAPGYEHALVKAADRISACVKCMEEQRAGNHEFDYAAENVRKSIEAIDLPEVKDFLTDFLPAFTMTLDELNHPSPSH